MTKPLGSELPRRVPMEAGYFGPRSGALSFEIREEIL